MVYSRASLLRPRVYVHCLRVRLNTDKQGRKTSVRPITPRDAFCLAPSPSCRVTAVGEGRVPVSASREGPAMRRTGAARVSRDCCFAGSCAGSPCLASFALSLSLSGYRKRNPSPEPEFVVDPNSDPSIGQFIAGQIEVERRYLLNLNHLSSEIYGAHLQRYTSLLRSQELHRNFVRSRTL